MKGNNDVLEKHDVLVSQGHCEPCNDGGKQIEKRSDTIELVGLMDQ